MDESRIKRLHFQCRRGMKELDMLLERFIEREQRQLRGGAWPDLEALLATEDDRLWAWLQDTGHAGAGPFRPLLDRIRHGATDIH